MGDYFIHINSNGILQFTINRPEKRNAINYEVMNGLQEALNECEENRDVKAFVITGMGDKAFCSGGDLSKFHNLITENESFVMLNKMGQLLKRLAFLQKPTIALINGTAIGGGCEIATACDFRIAKKHAKMGFVQGNLAITTGFGGGTLLLEKIAPSKALSLLMTAKVMMAEELAELGFIDEVVEHKDALNESPLVKGISSKSIGVLMAYKAQLLAKWNIKKLEENMNKEIRECSKLWAMEEHHEEVRKFLKKRSFRKDRGF